MEITFARKRLEEMRDELDRSISILHGEHPGPQAGVGYPQDSADAGASLSEADRTEAVLIGTVPSEKRCSPRSPASRKTPTDSAWTAGSRFRRAGSTRDPKRPAA